MPTIHLIEGPIGAGKSTYAMGLAARLGAPSLCVDQWFATLFVPDRPPAADVEWYLERKARCVELIWQTAIAVLKAGSPVVLELGLVRREDRQRMYDRIDGTGVELNIHVVDAPVEVRRERVRRRNMERGETWSVDITEEMFERSTRWWEPLDDTEYSVYLVYEIDGS